MSATPPTRLRPGTRGLSSRVLLILLAAASNWVAECASAQNTPPVAQAPSSSTPSSTPSSSLLLELIAPAELVAAGDPSAPAAMRTTQSSIHLLGRSTPGARVSVGDSPVTVFATGLFARDRIPLNPGLNTLRVQATAADGQTLTRDLQIERVAPPPPMSWPQDALYIDGASLRPAEAVQLAPGEGVEVAARATPGRQLMARLPGQGWQALAEDAAQPGHYRARLVFAASGDVTAAPVQVRLVAARAAPRSETKGQAHRRPSATRDLQVLTPGSVGQWRADADRLYAVGPEGADLMHGLHEVRLGGPYLAELPPGTLLNVVGQQGDFLRVQLSPDTTAWAAASALQPAPVGTAPPWAAPTSLAVSGQPDGSDLISIPLTARMPYAVRAVSSPDGRHHLEVDLYGAHDAATWISHRASARLVREISVSSPGPGRLRVQVALQQPRLWGWRSERTDSALRISVLPAPVLADSAAPLKGLRIALEAGHGSAANTGAVGATGVFEKDISRLTTLALQAELEAAGAQVWLVRSGDENPSLLERAQRVLASDAQLFISVHGNAADTRGGYLRVAGTSSYYKHAQGRDLAAAIHRRVLAETGLDDFGRIGNFNYTPIRRITTMPAVLFEQAFLTHLGDEARLLDPAFRARMARAVRMGVEDFLRGP